MASLMRNSGDKRVGNLLLVSVLLSLACVPAVGSVFGIPDFLEYGTCANITLMEDFDPVKFTGLWFDIASVPNEYQQTKECVSHKYTWRDDHMSVVSRGLSEAGLKIRQSLAFVLDEERKPPNPAHMKVIVEGMPESPYQVITTDYRRYSCVYSCLEYFGFRAEFIWLYSRTPNLSQQFANRCYSALATMDIDYTKMISIKQDESCPYYKKLDQLLANNNKLMNKILGPELPTLPSPTTTTTTTTTTTPSTTTTTTTILPTTTTSIPPTTTTTIPPTTSTTTRPLTTTIEETTPPTTPVTTTTTTTTTSLPTSNPATTTTTTTTIPPNTTPPSTTPVATQPPTTTDPPNSAPVITVPPTNPSTTSSVPPSTTTTTSPAPTSGRPVQGTSLDLELDEQSVQKEKVKASRRQTVLSSAKEVTPSGGMRKRDHDLTQDTSGGLASSSGLVPVGLLLPVLMGAAPILVLL